MPQLLEQIHLLVTYALLGLIWTIQLVHYPSFRFVEENSFTSFEQFHTKSIAIIVMPLMLVELTLVTILPFIFGFEDRYLISFLIVVLIWMSTFFLSVPCHERLSRGKDLVTIERLVLTNWPRTVLWSLKAVLLCF